MSQRRAAILLVLLAALVGVAASVPAALAAAPGTPAAAGAYRVGEITVTFTDRSRRIRLPNGGSAPRKVTTEIRYPATGAAARGDVRGAAPVRNAGRFPLIVFAHGFDVTPDIYARLLRAWAAAGYVVAAPIFPLTNPGAPGGADEADLVHQPGDMSLVITRLIQADAAPTGILSHLVDRRRVAVSGQSDGGSTALATAYNFHFRDRRVRAAIILSGARIPGVGGYTFPAPRPPLLAVQGTADLFNAFSSTLTYFRLAPRPKFLLSLLGAPHLAPYTYQQPQLGIVERTSLAFLGRYLQHVLSAGRTLDRVGNVPGLARLTDLR